MKTDRDLIFEAYMANSKTSTSQSQKSSSVKDIIPLSKQYMAAHNNYEEAIAEGDNSAAHHYEREMERLSREIEEWEYEHPEEVEW